MNMNKKNGGKWKIKVTIAVAQLTTNPIQQMRTAFHVHYMHFMCTVSCAAVNHCTCSHDMLVMTCHAIYGLYKAASQVHFVFYHLLHKYNINGNWKSMPNKFLTSCIQQSTLSELTNMEC